MPDTDGTLGKESSARSIPQSQRISQRYSAASISLKTYLDLCNQADRGKSVTFASSPEITGKSKKTRRRTGPATKSRELITDSESNHRDNNRQAVIPEVANKKQPMPKPVIAGGRKATSSKRKYVELSDEETSSSSDDSSGRAGPPSDLESVCIVLLYAITSPHEISGAHSANMRRLRAARKTQSLRRTGR